MKDISSDLDFFLKQYRGKCGNFKNGTCDRLTLCPCEQWASVWAYIQHLIPADCQKLKLDDFTGQVNGERVLHPAVVTAARRNLIRYCWGKGPDDLNPDDKATMLRSVLDDRRRNGTSVVIHGGPPPTNSFTKTIPKKSGRTLLASIIMREVLKRRLFEGHAADNYDWVQYQTLKSRVMAGHADAIIDYQSNDWLVVDNIFIDKRGSEAAKVFVQEKLDAVFMERIDQGLPTILVFQFDITPHRADLQDLFGVGISQIALDENTHTISLNNKE